MCSYRVCSYRICQVKGCYNHSRLKRDDLFFVGIPQDEMRQKQFSEILRTDFSTVSKSSKICSDHFPLDAIDQTTLKLLPHAKPIAPLVPLLKKKNPVQLPISMNQETTKRVSDQNVDPPSFAKRSKIKTYPARTCKPSVENLYANDAEIKKEVDELIYENIDESEVMALTEAALDNQAPPVVIEVGEDFDGSQIDIIPLSSVDDLLPLICANDQDLATRFMPLDHGSLIPQSDVKEEVIDDSMVTEPTTAVNSPRKAKRNINADEKGQSDSVAKELRVIHKQVRNKLLYAWVKKNKVQINVDGKPEPTLEVVEDGFGDKICAVQGCYNAKGVHDVYLFRCPRDEKQYLVWQAALQDPSLGKGTNVCSEHFKQRAINYQNELPKLKTDVIPTTPKPRRWSAVTAIMAYEHMKYEKKHGKPIPSTEDFRKELKLIMQMLSNNQPKPLREIRKNNANGSEETPNVAKTATSTIPEQPTGCEFEVEIDNSDNRDTFTYDMDVLDEEEWKNTKGEDLDTFWAASPSSDIWDSWPDDIKATVVTNGEVKNIQFKQIGKSTKAPALVQATQPHQTTDQNLLNDSQNPILSDLPSRRSQTVPDVTQVDPAKMDSADESFENLEFNTRSNESESELLEDPSDSTKENEKTRNVIKKKPDQPTPPYTNLVRLRKVRVRLPKSAVKLVKPVIKICPEYVEDLEAPVKQYCSERKEYVQGPNAQVKGLQVVQKMAMDYSRMCMHHLLQEKVAPLVVMLKRTTGDGEKADIIITGQQTEEESDSSLRLQLQEAKEEAERLKNENQLLKKQLQALESADNISCNVETTVEIIESVSS